MSSAVHMVLHFAVPLAIAWLFYRPQWLRAFLILIATMLVDLDHLLATPIFDPDRCSIGFHPLHRWPAIAVYCLMLLPAKTRILGIGLLVHMILDWGDCQKFI